jgi:hypothetical protein
VQHTSASLEAGSLPSRIRTLNLVLELPGVVLKVIPANRFARAKSSQRVKSSNELLEQASPRPDTAGSIRLVPEACYSGCSTVIFC